MRYKVQVTTDKGSRLMVRSSPSLGSNIIGKKNKGDTFIVDKAHTSPDGYKWYRIEGTNNWCCSKVSGGDTLLKIVQDLEKKTVATTPSNKGTNANPNAGTSQYVLQSETIYIEDANDSLTKVPGNSNGTETTDSKTFSIYTSTSYPKKYGGSTKYPLLDYKTNYDEFEEALNTIKENMNIPSFYNQQQINKLAHENFNRYRIEYPDLYMRSTIPVIVFTRPDLNLFSGAGRGQLQSHTANDARTQYALMKNEKIGRLLTSEGYSNISHKFNPLLSNLAQNLEIADDSIKLLETGETLTGYKMQYSKHNIESVAAGNLNIKFKETFDLAVTNMHQIWVDYQSNVYRGSFKPKREYIYEKCLDYACNIYYFLLDQDGETIRFWTKYFGVFPNNVPKSAFGFDMGSNVSYPEVSVTYSYIYKEDLSPISLVEFNHDAGDASLGYKYIKGYVPDLGHSGKTWVGVPFISSYTYNNGVQSNAQGFKLRWRPKELL